LSGDEEAFRALVEKYLHPIYNFVHFYVYDDHAAEDVTQDIFVKVWKHMKKFDANKSFKIWVYAIAKNTSFDYLKKKRMLNFSALERDENIYDIKDILPLPPEILKLKDIGEVLSRALQRLPDKYREILILYYRNDFNFREISEFFHEPVNTVKSRHRRALALLRKVLLEKGGQEKRP